MSQSPSPTPLRGPLPEGRRRYSRPVPLKPARKARPRSVPSQPKAASGFTGLVESTLRSRKMRVTTPRMNMLRALADSPVPLSAEDLHAALPSECDLVTVYRSLAALEAIGLVKKLYAFDGIVLYVSGTSAPTYVVLPRGNGAGASIAPDVTAELTVAIRKTVEHLTAAGFRNVQPVVQFFGDKDATDTSPQTE